MTDTPINQKFIEFRFESLENKIDDNARRSEARHDAMMSKMDAFLEKFNEHLREDSAVHQRVLGFDQRIESVESDKKGWVGIGAGLTALLTAIGSAFTK